MDQDVIDEEQHPLRNVWIRPRGCDTDTGDCVQVMFATDDSDQVTDIFIKGATQGVTPDVWRTFLRAVRDGEYDI